jgi:helix-turn-helix protein
MAAMPNTFSGTNHAGTVPLSAPSTAEIISFPVNGVHPPHGLNGATHSVGIGHNSTISTTASSTAALVVASPALQPTPPSARSIFDEFVKENRRALYLAQRDVLLRALCDQRLQPRHEAVLAAIIVVMNNDGTAFPGYTYLAQVTGYSEGTVRRTIEELRHEFGYIAYAKYAAEPGGKALAHYTVIKPGIAEIQAAIAACLKDLRHKKELEVSAAPHTSSSPDLNGQEIEVRKADLNADPGLTSMPMGVEVREADLNVTCGLTSMWHGAQPIEIPQTAKVTRREVVTRRKREGADAPLTSRRLTNSRLFRRERSSAAHGEPPWNLKSEANGSGSSLSTTSGSCAPPTATRGTA